MDKFWDYFSSEQNLISFREEYCVYDQSPSRTRFSSLTSFLGISKTSNPAQESLSEISQDLLDLAIFSRSNLIKTVEEFQKYIFGFFLLCFYFRK